MITIARRLSRGVNGIIGLSLLGVVLILVVLDLTGVGLKDVLAQNSSLSFHSPTSHNIFGTDQFGRDIMSRSVAGLVNSLRIGLIAVAIASVIGTTLGIIGGFVGGIVDDAIGRMSDLLFACPAVLLALAIVSALGPGSFNTAIAIAIVYIPIFIRVARGPVLSLREREFVKAASLLGFSKWRVMRHHILPNLAAPVIVQISLSLSWAVLTESGLSFLGLGTQPPNPSLGLMVSEAQAFAATAWWTLLFPSVFIVLLVVTFNMLGDGLRDALDPSWNRE
ncbi:putative D,D-dipeptide transport system permease protein DdpC [mine drainage metagenome]|uniref:Putative D,D-dipeptide transport system permease protein DdpC n=1 Tax=mine drainage metagenome TaxID=410659 RepID=A0A1J5Q3J2_9ZZZZ